MKGRDYKEKLKRTLKMGGICAWLLALITACAFGDEPSVCPYNVRLEYWYAASNVENVLPVYVDNIRQYLFDSTGKLLATTELKGDSVTGWSGDLAEGEYTLVLWGNLNDSDRTPVEDGQSGQQLFEEMTVSAVTQGVPPGYRGNTGRLYYGAATLKVEKGFGIHQRVYLSHAHAALSVTVRWMTDEVPPLDGVYRMRLKGIPSIYGFTPGLENTTPAGDGTYYLPQINGKATYHETRAAMNYDEEVIGEFVTFRYLATTHEIWSLWCNDRQIVRELDLNSFFAKLPMDMDRNMEQEFDLLVTIYDDRIVVTQATAADWDEGGTIG